MELSPAHKSHRRGSLRFEEAHSRIEEAEIKDSKDLMKICSKADLLKVAYFYEGLGLLVRKRLVNPELVLEMFRARTMWAKTRPWMDDRRRRLSPLAGEHFEHLAELDSQYKTRRIAELKEV